MKIIHYIETLGKQYTSEFVQEFQIYFGNSGGDYQVSYYLWLFTNNNITSTMMNTNIIIIFISSTGI